MKFSKLFSLVLALILVFSFNSFKAEQQPKLPTLTQPAAEQLELLPDDKVIATVNGVNVVALDANQLYSAMLQQYAMYGFDTKKIEFQKNIYNSAKESAIQKSVILQKATELGLDKLTDEEKKALEDKANSTYEELLKALTAQLGLKDTSTAEEKAKITADAEKKLVEFKYTKDKILENEILNKTLKNVEAYLSKYIVVSEEEVKSKYDELVANDKAKFETNIQAFETNNSRGVKTWFVPEGFKGIKHILLSVDEPLLSKVKELSAKLEESSNTHNQEAQATNAPTEEPKETSAPVTQADLDAANKAVLDSVKTKTDEIYKKFKEGTKFDDLVVEYGTDPGMKQEPYKTKGYLVNKDSVVYDPAFTNAAAELQSIGSISQPIIGMYGVHILYYDSDIKSGAAELNDENKTFIENQLLNEKKTKAVTSGIDEWKKSYEIVNVTE